jgi:hypothetical protein
VAVSSTRQSREKRNVRRPVLLVMYWNSVKEIEKRMVTLREVVDY